MSGCVRDQDAIRLANGVGLADLVEFGNSTRGEEVGAESLNPLDWSRLATCSRGRQSRSRLHGGGSREYDIALDTLYITELK